MRNLARQNSFRTLMFGKILAYNNFSAYLFWRIRTFKIFNFFKIFYIYIRKREKERESFYSFICYLYLISYIE